MGEPSKRLFEHADEGKFWEIWVDGPKIFTRHGKLGSNGQTKVKDGDAAAFEKMIKEKVVAGYVQTGGEVLAGPELDKKELKRLLSSIKSRTDDAVLVLADWLQTQNHPWGELIALQHGAATNPKKAASLGKQADKHLKENGPAILGELASAKYSSFEWECGLLRRAVIGCPANAKAMLAAVKALRANPVAAAIESVVVCPYRAEFDTWRDWGQSKSFVVDPWTDLDGLAKAIPASATRVGLGGWPAPAAAGYVAMPSFAKVSTTFADATSLELTGFVGDKPTKLSLSKVTDLAVRYADANDAALKALATSKLPKLERLTVWLGGSSNVTVDDVHPPREWEEDNDESRYPATFSAADLEHMSPYDIDVSVTPAGLTELLSARWSPSLKHLELGAPRWTAELLAAVAASPLVKTLSSLTIAGGDLDDVKALTKKAFGHLESFQITSVCSEAAAKKLETTFPDLKVRTDGESENFHFRFVATVE